MLQKLEDNEGHREPVSVAVYDWAPDGKSPANSSGPTGLNYKLLVKLLAGLLLPSDARMDICCMEACIFGADPATCQHVTSWQGGRLLYRNGRDATVHGTSLTRPGVLAPADAPTAGAHSVLQRKLVVALNRAGIQLAMALAAGPCDLQLVVCVGAHAMRVRHRSVHPKLSVFDVQVGQPCMATYQPFLLFCV